MSQIELAVATANAGKLNEIRMLLADLDLKILSLADFPELPPIVEDGATFRENAFKKADTLFAHCGLPTIGDDSGLVVDALGGRPGVLSARFAGLDADDLDNNDLLIEKMKEVPDDKRGCAFVCNLAFVAAGERELFEGRLEGQVLRKKRGKRGFGYDPLFLLPDRGVAVAEIPIEEKNKISHRGQALKLFAQYFRGFAAAGRQK